MRKILSLNENWLFCKDTADITKSGGESVSLPHTWNAKDGQDGGNDYFRGSCVYRKLIEKASLPKAKRYYLEICGANLVATVYANSKKLFCHNGGYSTFRVDLTDSLTDKTELAIVVDNSPCDSVYPQMADFTFYGGLYRNVNLICVSNTHFALDYFGTSGLKITPTVCGNDATVEIEMFAENFKAGQKICCTLYDSEENELQKTETEELNISFKIENVHLWNGVLDPYLYSCKAEITENGEVLDNISARFGCRSFEIDPQNGFILNGKEYPLHGVSRHQDRLSIGNALLPEHHREDINLIMEMGANTVRLAHYQHDSYFYDLCDEAGLVVWAEIPYISKHLPEGRENTISQLKELIIQNYNHPSIVVWGLSNEISIAGSSDDLLENHKILNDLAHSMDKTRQTVIAAVSMCSIDDPYLQIPDAVCYNHYFGWYGGETDMNGPWFDNFHKKFPDIPIGISEYGCEALNWHSSAPRQGDYTEEYQAYYHEQLIKQLFTRKYIWASFVWNMFDFGADARNEGGENGQNHKGLVTFDRKYKKDAFYAYKAWLSEKPFVHICSKRYVDRVENPTKVTVYSNLPEVELFVNGKSVGKKSAADHFFRFEVPNTGHSTLKAIAGTCTDQSTICKVDKMNEDYLLKEQGAVLNWFDVNEREGYLSLNDKISDILEVPLGKAWFEALGVRLKSAMEKSQKSGAMGFELSEDMMKMMGGFTLLRMTGMLGMMNISFTKEELLDMNKQLNQIRKK